ncbi:adenylate isopentenyltransferase 5, chloroplastic-like [Rhodamnia argentea]|uniref:adenylate dimethylallyltransferase (ADP/ATP-dependent) n=1 Tax=Rhodamnia argentea TaxID=178133 RepID=A0A8B8NRB8_9MYRT|nr:adenylate isopentenyltransferase 5, chloroplastic-like [Rhodamnia argentea]
MKSIHGAPKLNKPKVVFIMGATGTGKTKLSIDLAIHFQTEIINSDKIQVYKGLDVVTNKVTELERRGVPHHLLGVIDDPDVDFSVHDFCRDALIAIKQITERGCVAIVAGGSNSFIEVLVEDPTLNFRSIYDCCFIWLDVLPPVLNARVSKRVDEMVAGGLIDEVRGIFIPQADYLSGIRRAIGVPEMDRFLRVENHMIDDGIPKEVLLDEAINEIKVNTFELTCRQVEKIRKLIEERGWNIRRIDATGVFECPGKDVEKAWESLVLEPSLAIVGDFLNGQEKAFSTTPDQFPAALPQVRVEMCATN